MIDSWPYQIIEDSVIVKLRVDAEPKSKARPKFTRNGRAYTSKETRAYEDMLRLLFIEAMNGRSYDSDERYGLRCLFYRSDRRRIDCDNMIKAVSDAANGILWKDDAQVHEITAKLFLASDEPRTEVLVYRVDDPDKR